MISRIPHGARKLWIAAILGLCVSVIPVSSALAHGGGGGGGHGGGMGGMGGHMGGMGGWGGMGGHMGGMGYGHMGGMGYGHMGGLGYGNHLGYGYGGYGLGYGGFGTGYGLGYGGYGGYGYPYGAGYGYGDPYYGYNSGYGYGYPNYSNAYYPAPAGGVTYSSAYVAPTTSAANTVTLPQGRYLGIDEEPIVEASGRRGMKVTNVYPGTAAQRAGLRTGDVIYSINGYLTEQRGNLAWIIANAAPANQLTMNIKRSVDGQERAVTAEIK